MSKTRIVKLVLCCLFLGLIAISAQAQHNPMPPMEDNGPRYQDGPPMGPQGFDGPPPQMGQRGQRPPQMRGQRPGNRGHKRINPEERKKQQAIMAIAEAHKELSRIYISKNKIDEAAAELKKILALVESEDAKDLAKNKKGQKMVRKLMPVYNEIARLYAKNNRLDDAEKILNEGISKFEKEDPQAATQLILSLARLQRQNKQEDKAEATYKRIIKINTEVLNK